MKKNIYIIVGLGAIVIIAGWLFFPNYFQQNSVLENNIIEQTEEEDVILEIDEVGENPKSFMAEFKEGMTVFDLLKNKIEESNIALETKSYDMGVMIEAIGDKKNGQDGKYWLYYVNGQMPMVSADKMEIKAGDKVEFKFEKSPF